ncbi:putative T7SS-secreted protein [Peterkaempfera bronchialis]|uniref:putative T7SS-secreted protein n=1 Tax=Peterkaempfera bronchialis TaxID=2126346 RepID=UPI003C2EA51C
MSQDPTPGDPDEIRRLASRYREIGDQAETATRILSGGGAVEQGSGQAMDALRGQLKSLPDKLGRTADSFSEAATAYETYAGQLEDAQSQVDRAMDQAGPVAGTARQTVPPLAEDATDEQREEARRQQDGIDAAQQSLSGARRLAEDARNLREQASRRAGQELDDAAAKAIPERNFFQKIADFFADFPFVKILIDILVAVVTVFFPVVGLVLGGLLFALQTVQQIVTGDFKTGDFLVGLLAIVPGGSLLKLGGRAAELGITKVSPALLKGISSGGFFRSVAGSVTKATETVTGTKAFQVAFDSPGGKLVTGAISEFGHKVGEEAVVKKLNGDEITAANLLAGAAAGAVVGAGIRGARGFRGGEFDGGAFTPRPRPAAEVPEPAPVGLRGALIDQGVGLVQEGASSGAKVGVAVAEGTAPAEAVAGEAANFLPGSVGSVGKRAFGHGVDSIFPAKGTSHGPGPAAPAPTPAPAAAPTPAPAPAPVVEPHNVPLPPSPTTEAPPRPVSPPRPEPQDIPLPPSPTTEAPPASAPAEPQNVPLPPSPTIEAPPRPVFPPRPEPQDIPLPPSPTTGSG